MKYPTSSQSQPTCLSESNKHNVGMGLQGGGGGGGGEEGVGQSPHGSGVTLW